MANKLTVRSFVIMDDETVPWEQLTDEQIEGIKNHWSERLSRTASDYYTRHPKEYAAL